METALEKEDWGIIGMSEIRRNYETIQERKSGNMLLHSSGNENGNYGTGFLVNKNMTSYIKNFKPITERIALLEIEINTKKFSILQLHAPTTSYPDEVCDLFFEKVSNEIEIIKSKLNKSENLLVIGDYNACIGKQKKGEEYVMGNNNFGKRNNRGENLINFAGQNNLKIANSFFDQAEEKKWTWRSPKDEFFELDYILTNKINNIKNLSVIKLVGFQTDHNMVKAEIFRKSASRKYVNKPIPHLKIKHAPTYVKELEDILATKDIDDSKTVQEMYDMLESSIKEAVRKENELNKNIKNKRSKKLSENTIKLIEKREELNRIVNKTTQQKIEHSEIRKLVQREIRKDIKIHEDNIIKTIMEKTGSTKEIKKEISYNKKCWIGKLVKEDGTILTDRDEILEEATKHFEKIYTDTRGRDTEAEHSMNSTTSTVKDTPEFTKSEIEYLINDLKNEKAPGNDKITNELITTGKSVLIKYIKDLFTAILEQEKIPEQWKINKVILLHKKGQRDKISNYRPITLSPTLYKLFTKALQRRLKKLLDENQTEEQAGFRPGYSTTDHLHTVNLLLEKSNEYNIPLYMAFIDYSLAFDSINHCYIWQALGQVGVQTTYINLLREVYKNNKAYVSLENDGRHYNINKGVKQGCPLSPDLFNAVLEGIFKELNWNGRGIKINGNYLTNLRFADDIVLFSNCPTELEIMINELNTASKLRGLKMNPLKTKIMTSSASVPISLDNTVIEQVSEYIYLGQILSTEDRQSQEVSRRITIAWKKYWSLKSIVKGNHSTNIKKQVLESCILPTLTYGCQTWALTEANKNKIKTTQNKMQRSLLNIKKEQKIRNSTINTRLKAKRVEEIITHLKFKWAGHISRSNEKKWSKQLTEWIPLDRKRNRGRQKKRWSDEIKIKFGPLWSRHARDREKWKHMIKNIS